MCPPRIKPLKIITARSTIHWCLLISLLANISATTNYGINVKAKENPTQEISSTAECKLNYPGSAPIPITKHPLFDTKYKQAANYMPLIAMRVLAYSKIYRKKGKAQIRRYYYLKNTKGEFSDPYAELTMDVQVEGKGLFGRTIKAKGKLNGMDLVFFNDMKFSLPKKALMNISASLDSCNFLSLRVESDGDKLTNDVNGVFFSKPVKYHTNWRNTKGMLANAPYEIYVEGVHNEKMLRVVSKGFIGDESTGQHSIKGQGVETKENYYEIEEYYGPLLIKTFVHIDA